MRDLLFKNLTSTDRKRKIISTSEIAEKQGIRSIIRRHFVCIIKEVKDGEVEKPEPYLYVLKVHNTKEHKEKFFCRIKGSVTVVFNHKLFMIQFMHSLKIDLTAISQDIAKYSW
jgi:hypothetical protein